MEAILRFFSVCGGIVTTEKLRGFRFVAGHKSFCNTRLSLRNDVPWLAWLGASSRTFLKVLKGWSQEVFGVSTFSTNVCSESICSPYVNFALDLNLFYRWQAIMRTLRNCLRTQSINTSGRLCTDAKNTSVVHDWAYKLVKSLKYLVTYKKMIIV